MTFNMWMLQACCLIAWLRMWGGRRVQQNVAQVVSCVSQRLGYTSLISQPRNQPHRFLLLLTSTEYAKPACTLKRHKTCRKSVIFPIELQASMELNSGSKYSHTLAAGYDIARSHNTQVSASHGSTLHCYSLPCMAYACHNVQISKRQ